MKIKTLSGVLCVSLISLFAIGCESTVNVKIVDHTTGYSVNGGKWILSSRSRFTSLPISGEVTEIARGTFDTGGEASLKYRPGNMLELYVDGYECHVIRIEKTIGILTRLYDDDNKLNFADLIFGPFIEDENADKIYIPIVKGNILVPLRRYSK